MTTDRLNHELMLLEDAVAAGRITREQADADYNRLMDAHEDDVTRTAKAAAYDEYSETVVLVVGRDCNIGGSE